MGTFSADNAQNGFADMPCGFDKDMFYYGVEASLKGKKVALDPTEASSIIDAYSEEVRAAQMASEAELEAAAKDNNAEYLANNKTKEGMITTESGLQYRVIRQGRGDKPKANSTVKVHYTGTLTDGTKFDSSYDRGKPAEFPVNGVIPGWQEGLQLMPVGSKYEFVIPPELGYGSRDLGSIPPNSILLFEVELLGIVK
ncbi:MAG: FKBP-type peptidyl-prolyl cis-trans isomerase [Bacteroidales bacterium]|nr:FKBP-type peptidyl-prolyl cis-trans isomerase [Bacteroidales bacterium]